jgi:hypothetical protein
MTKQRFKTRSSLLKRFTSALEGVSRPGKFASSFFSHANKAALYLEKNIHTQVQNYIPGYDTSYTEKPNFCALCNGIRFLGLHCER